MAYLHMGIESRQRSGTESSILTATSSGSSDEGTDDTVESCRVKASAEALQRQSDTQSQDEHSGLESAPTAAPKLIVRIVLQRRHHRPGRTLALYGFGLRVSYWAVLTYLVATLIRSLLHWIAAGDSSVDLSSVKGILWIAYAGVAIASILVEDATLSHGQQGVVPYTSKNASKVKVQ